MKKAELLATLNNFLIEQYANGRKVLLIVDEAQNLYATRCWRRSACCPASRPPRRRCCASSWPGQPELNDKLELAELVQLAQRMRLRFHLTALSKSDMRCISSTAWRSPARRGGEIFDPETFAVIFRYTGGIPRLINTLCDTAMMAAFAQDKDDRHARPHAKRRSTSCSGSEYAERSVTAASAAPRTRRRTRMARFAGHGASGASRVGRILVGFNGQTVAERELVPGRFIIGRTPDNDLQIDSKYISRHHAQIITSVHGSVVEDLNSTNGIYVRAKRVRRRMLNDGDVVQIGQHEIMYFDERLSRTRALPGDIEDDAVTARAAK